MIAGERSPAAYAITRGQLLGRQQLRPHVHSGQLHDHAEADHGDGGRQEQGLRAGRSGADLRGHRRHARAATASAAARPRSGEAVASPYAITRAALGWQQLRPDFHRGHLDDQPKPITVTAANKSKVYGSADPALTYTVPAGSSRRAIASPASSPAQRARRSPVAPMRSPGQPLGWQQLRPDLHPGHSRSARSRSRWRLTTRRRFTARPIRRSPTRSPPARSSGDSFTGALTRAAGEAVAGSPYAINKGSLGWQQLHLTVTGHLTISQKLTRWRRPTKTKVYGSADPALTYTVAAGTLETGDSFSGELTLCSGRVGRR